MRRPALLLLVLMLPTLLGGCAAAVVGGVVAGAGVASIAHDRRTTGSYIEDKEIQLRASGLLDEYPELAQQSDIAVTSYNMQVLLTGQAASDEVSATYASLVSRLPRVRKVFNEVETRAAASWEDSTGDTWLTLQVKTALADVGLEGFDPLRVKVVSALGTVYLMGLLTEEEAALVTDEVRYVRGVERVVRLFEIVTLE